MCLDLWVKIVLLSDYEKNTFVFVIDLKVNMDAVWIVVLHRQRVREILPYF